MIKKWKMILLGIITVVVVGVLVSALYVNNVGVSNLKLMYTLRTSDKTIIAMEETTDGNGYYLTKLRHPADTIKDRMNKEGWNYVEQNGSGLFFEKENEKAIVTTKIWHRNYIKILVQHNVVNLADTETT